MPDQRRSNRIASLAVGLLLGGSAFAAVPVAPYFNGAFPKDAPGSSNVWKSENAFPHLTFVDPVWIVAVPGSNDVVVVEKTGKLKRFPNSAASTPGDVGVLLDLGSFVQASEDQGLYQMVFHPEFGDPGSAHAGEIFVTYNYRPDNTQVGADKSMWRLSRFRWIAGQPTIEPSSETVLVQQFDPHRWHNGGAMAFDRDGFLLFLCGDGGGFNDEFAQSQRLDGGFFGGVFRIDVDSDPARSHPIRRQPREPSGKPGSFPPSFTQGYLVPNANPWVDAADTRLEETFAIGLRSPHGAHFDSETNEFWVGDVGQNAREELNRVTRGANLQWPFQEGTNSGPKSRSSPAGVETIPVYSYDRVFGGCIIGGMRYRGAKWADQLGGKVIFGDNLKGTVYALAPDSDGGPVTFSPLLSDIGTGIYAGLANICTDPEGDIYLMKLNGTNKDGGKILKMVAGQTSPEAPPLLSQTGLFSDTAGLVPSAALMPFEVASPLWSDGAVKRRWIILPNDGTRNAVDEKIAFSGSGNWSFPAGTVFVKHFEMEVDGRDPSVIKRLETRVMVCTAGGGKYGVTYRWNEEGTDAVLLSGGEDSPFTVTRPDGSNEQRTWSYPSRSDCMQCHTADSGQALGLRTHQINRNVFRLQTGEMINQLRYLDEELIFSPAIMNFSNLLEARALEDSSAPLEHRVRSYLDSNCASCHQPGGAVPYFDARLETPLKSQGLMNAAIRGQFELPGGCYLKPGSAAQSAVHVRVASAQPGVAMPPLGKHLVDAQAADLISSYLTGINAAEFAAEPVPLARYFSFSGNALFSNIAAVGELVVLDGEGMAIPHGQMSVTSFTSEGTPGNSALAIDGDPWTSWITATGNPSTKSIVLDLGSLRQIGGFEYHPRQDLATARLRSYTAAYSVDGQQWTQVTSKTVGNNPTAAKERFEGLIGRRPVRCSIAASPSSIGKDFPVTIVFDSSLTDFDASDISVTGGTVKAVRGSGYYYVATITATQSQVTVSVPPNKVNPGPYGNLPSNTMTVSSGLQSPPVPTFAGSPEVVSGAFELRLNFDREVTGFTAEDLLLTNATLEWIIPENGGFRLILVPVQPSGVGVQLRDGAVMGGNGVQMERGISFNGAFAVPVMELEAEAMATFYMKKVDDPSASNGKYAWAEEGSRGSATSADTLWSLWRDLVVPFPGDYRLRGWIRADDFASDSFNVRLARVNTDSPLRFWQANQGAGEIGSTQFHPGLARGPGGAPHLFTLPAGTCQLTVFAAEDGARLDKVALIPARPFPLWSGRGASSSRPIAATLRFVSPVTGLSADDFEVIGGAITALSGTGQDYSLELVPDSGKMVLRLREGAVTDEFGATSITSSWHFVRFADTYDQWALDRGLGSLPAADSLDTDGDHIGQLMEYALGLDPSVPNFRTVDDSEPFIRGLPRIDVIESGAGRRLSVTFHRRRGGMPLRHVAEFTSDLTHFTRRTEYAELVPIDSDWERVTIVDESTDGSQPSRFGRLKVERTE